MSEQAKKEEVTKSAVKLVKVRALRPITNPATNIVVSPGQTIDVTEEQAAELTKDMKGAYAFRGERYNVDGEVKRHSLKRAELVA